LLRRRCQLHYFAMLAALLERAPCDSDERAAADDEALLMPARHAILRHAASPRQRWRVACRRAHSFVEDFAAVCAAADAALSPPPARRFRAHDAATIRCRRCAFKSYTLLQRRAAGERRRGHQLSASDASYFSQAFSRRALFSLVPPHWPRFSGWLLSHHAFATPSIRWLTPATPIFHCHWLLMTPPFSLLFFADAHAMQLFSRHFR